VRTKGSQLMRQSQRCATTMTANLERAVVARAVDRLALADW
jgi:hypothetical protein